MGNRSPLFRFQDTAIQPFVGVLVPVEGLCLKRCTKSLLYFCAAATNQLGFFDTIAQPVLCSFYVSPALAGKTHRDLFVHCCCLL